MSMCINLHISHLPIQYRSLCVTQQLLKICQKKFNVRMEKNRLFTKLPVPQRNETKKTTTSDKWLEKRTKKSSNHILYTCNMESVHIFDVPGQILTYKYVWIVHNQSKKFKLTSKRSVKYIYIAQNTHTRIHFLLTCCFHLVFFRSMSCQFHCTTEHGFLFFWSIYTQFSLSICCFYSPSQFFFCHCIIFFSCECIWFLFLFHC